MGAITKLCPSSLTVNREEATAEYIAEMCAELANVAEKAGMPTLAYFLGMARLEAEDQVDLLRSPIASSSGNLLGAPPSKF